MSTPLARSFRALALIVLATLLIGGAAAPHSLASGHEAPVSATPLMPQNPSSSVTAAVSVGSADAPADDHVGRHLNGNHLCTGEPVACVESAIVVAAAVATLGIPANIASADHRIAQGGHTRPVSASPRPPSLVALSISRV